MNNKHPHQHKVHLQIFLQVNGGRPEGAPHLIFIYILASTGLLWIVTKILLFTSSKGR